MPLHLLSPREVQAATDGDHADGGGLFLRVKGSNASWVYRYTAPDGRRREMGLGVAERTALATAGESIKRARRIAAEKRALLDRRIDPLEEKKRERSDAKVAGDAIAIAENGQKRSLAQVAREYHEQAVEPTRTTKHAAQWIASLERNIPEAMWEGPIGTVDPVQLFAGSSRWA